ncbi:PAS domain S-box-containing protein [Chitinophaga sp. YR573]|uniref:ATP-binding protein n=1 Tax=Chitinophaga sp. YR573 TaxID=1881040 RepID=UPI0008C161CA|nr:ATP-binding protein [Chitinophaga sp. YR573]SEW36895.1 PAS domain S-box-containing protein [Chitinophaga sp. YR573]
MEKTIEELKTEVEELRRQLYEANDTIEAIRTGQVDALIVEGSDGHQLYTLTSADAAYRVFFEKMTEGAVTLNRAGVILYCNSQFASMVALPLSNVIGLNFETFIHPEDINTYNEMFHRCWSEDCKGEVRLSHATVKLSLTALELATGPSLSVIITDISTQKKAQQLLENSNHQLEKINHALELSNHDLQQFASVASHDLQEPLRKIQMFSALLKSHNEAHLSDDSKKHLDKIIDASRRMKTLIIDVLSYSKLSATDNTFEYINLNSILDEFQEDFELTIQDKGATVKVGKLAAIDANKGQMRQVFQNILSNALKFSKNEEAPVIEINCKYLAEKSFDSEEQQNGPFCLITIKDNGIGFNEKYLSKIFDLFERLYSKSIYEGTGIGLAITKKIIEKHNGLIKAKSEEGKGSEFMFILPTHQ